MYPRTNYEMTKDDLKKILEACRPVPMIALQCGSPSSPQENANRAWAELGGRMGFDHMTVQPTGQGDRFFTAIPNETEESRERRIAEEAEQQRRAEIGILQSEIAARKARLADLGAA